MIWVLLAFALTNIGLTYAIYRFAVSLYLFGKLLDERLPDRRWPLRQAAETTARRMSQWVQHAGLNGRLRQEVIDTLRELEAEINREGKP